MGGKLVSKSEIFIYGHIRSGRTAIVKNKLIKEGIKAEVDLRNEKIGYKIREHSNSKIPVIIAVGKKESQEKTVSVRRIGSTETKAFKLDEFTTTLSSEVKSPIE